MDGYFPILREDYEAIRDLPDKDIKLYLYLVSRAAFKDGPLCKRGWLFDSLRGLSERTGIGVHSIVNAMYRLCKMKVICVNGDRKRHNIQITGYSKLDLAVTVSGTNRGQTGDNAVTKRGQLEEVKTLRSKKELKTPPIVPQGGDFDAYAEFGKVWDRYPKRRGRKAALRHFLGSVKGPPDVALIHSALSTYIAELKDQGRSMEYTQNGSTWFNNWRDFVPPDRSFYIPRPGVPKKVLPPFVYTEPRSLTTDDFKIMHDDKVKALGRCRTVDCEFCVRPSAGELVPIGDLKNLLSSMVDGKVIPAELVKPEE